MTFQQLRKLNRYSRRALAEKLGIDPAAIVKWESGLVGSPRTGTVFAVAKLFGISPEDVMHSIEAHRKA